MTRCLIVAGTHSGVGKTSVALGLMAALRHRGLKVQPFKVGPDYLDPRWHRLAAGCTSYNLDTWMSGADYVQQLFREKSAGADVAIVEGVMGLFDGASPTELSGSTAEIAALLNAPVLLIASARGAGRSFAATVKGFSELEPRCKVAAVIGNFCGSSRHATLLKEALAGSQLCAMQGWIPKDALPNLPSRHLGLRTPQETAQAETTIASLAEAVSANVDLDGIYELAASRPETSKAALSEHDLPGASTTAFGLMPSSRSHATSTLDQTALASSGPGDGQAATESFARQTTRPHRGTGRAHSAGVAEDPATRQDCPAKTSDQPPTLAVAMDQSFDFYYPDNLELLESHGVRLASFSPLFDQQVPAEADGLYFGGGYPEEAAAQLSQNTFMRESVARFARSGKVIYGECGGMMYLAQSMRDLTGQAWPMVGLLPFETRMLERRKRLGYVETQLVESTLWGPPGTTLRGHEFHYSEIVEPFSLAGWARPYQLRGARGNELGPSGFARGNVLASYVHQHFHSNRSAAACLVQTLLQTRRGRCGVSAL